MTKQEAMRLARVMRDQRPFLLDEDPNTMNLMNARSFFRARDTFVNVATALAEEVEQLTNGRFRKEIFLCNSRAVKLAPYMCTECGQRITDGKLCGHGNREGMGIE